MTVDDAFNILQSALDRCRFGDTRTRDVDEALIFLEERSALKWPFDNFRSALNSPRSSYVDREALWQALNAALNGIRLNVGLPQS